MYVHNENYTKLFESKYSLKNKQIYFLRNKDKVLIEKLR